MRLQVKELQKAVNAFSFHYHHGGVSSRGKSARGLLGLAIMEQMRVIKDCEAFVRPVHPNASSLIIMGSRNTVEYLETAVKQIIQIEEDNIRPIKNFEHLQK